MKLLVIGCGQCGGRIADEFARLNIRAHEERSIEIVTDAIAVNTDMADLAGLTCIRRNYQHRVVIGNQRTSGHGVGKINELGAEIAKDEGDKILEVVRESERLQETDAFLLAASAAGGTGSGAISVLTNLIKTSFPEKPVYNLIVLPFKYEESTEDRIVFNTGTCLKSAYLVADAVFLVDNQRFVKKNLSLSNNLHKINSMVVQPFYNLLCAGEEERPEFIGSKVLDAGDIIQTLSGWTAIGYGSVQKPAFRIFRDHEEGDFRNRATQYQEEMKTMNLALNDLSLKCNPTDAHRALYLICSSPEKMNMELIGELSGALRNVAKEAIIRSGDYPRKKKTMEITILLSELRDVGRINDLFTKVIMYLSTKKKQKGIGSEHERLEDAFKDIPTFI